MKQFLALALVFSLFLGVSGCKRNHESVIKDSMTSMKELVDVLKNVKDEDSAKAAVSKIESIAKDMKALSEEAKKMGEPSKEVNADLEKKYKADMEKITNDLSKEMMRIMMNDKLAGPISKAMSEIKSL
jgi:cytochrome c556